MQSIQEEELLVNSTKTIVKMLDLEEDILKRPFVIIKFNIYAQLTNSVPFPAEVGMAAFSLEKGLLDNYAALIDPGTYFLLNFPRSPQALRNLSNFNFL
jgi:hypothetical protein